MTSDVTLSAALRNNLLSLENTQNAINVHQGRLATGKKVNSALDNPQSFFAAQALTNRANDLNNILDSLGQSIQVINAANNGVSALTTLINQQQSIANSAQSTLAGASTTAKTSGIVNLGDGTAKYTSFAGAVANDTIHITVTDTSGGFTANQSINNQTITILGTDTINDVVTKINDLNTTGSLTTPAIKASLDSSGHLTFEAVNGGTLNVQFRSVAATTAGDLTEANVLGFGTIAKSEQNGAAAANSTQDLTVLATNSITSKGLYTAVGVLAQGTTVIGGGALKDSTGAALTTGLVAADTYTLKVNGVTSADLLHYSGATGATATIQTVVDAINHDSSIKSLVSASFNTSTGQIQLTPLTASATDVQFVLTSAAGTSNLNLGFGTNAFATGAGAGAKASEDIYFGAAAGTLSSLQTQYNTGLAQISSLVTDTGYQGTNLLNGNSLTTYFDETRSSSLNTAGVTFTAGGLGLTTANFQNAAAIGTSITQLQTALTNVRNFGSTLATNLAVIQARQTFTTSLINTLQTGSDALTNADQNAEGASLLALQTRQSLGITALSLASQSQQAVLRLFG